MPYSQAHKDETRRSILTVAARLFRRHGYDGVGIDKIMAEAGLTRGGFYNHFRSKQALFKELFGNEHDYIARLSARTGANPTELNHQARGVAADYLHPEHRAAVFAGCSLTALATDSARSDASTQKRYAKALEMLKAEFQRDGSSEQSALQAIVASVGGLLLASACAADTELSAKVSDAASALAAQCLDPNAGR